MAPLQPLARRGRQLVASKMQPLTKQTDLKIGDRIRLSELGRAKARTPERQGVVLKQFTQTKFEILWDGLRSPQTMHCTLLEKID